MEKILLVEPNYKNKYPPVGLMKMSSYFKSKGDFVQFHKGLLPSNEVVTFDKVFITTLFTFDFDMCIQTIKYYRAIIGANKIFVGGIASSIMPEKFETEVPDITIIRGQLTSSNTLGYSDNVNIDVMPLDYDILWDIDYDYPARDSYFIYTTRGCPRKCSFCAVKTLEPSFYDCQNIEEQINSVDIKFGIKRNLLIMDNNILYSEKLSETVKVLEKLGFGVKNNSCKKNSNFKYYVNSLVERIKIDKDYTSLLIRIKKEFERLKFSRINKSDAEVLQKLLIFINNNEESEFVNQILLNKEFLIDFFERYHYHKIKRYVDFNQGLDARLFCDEKAKELSRLAVRPCRIAFDHIETKDTYISAIETATRYGIRTFSNYLLYNYTDKPEDLWERLFINVDFCEKNKEKKVTLFSFPMKYASITETDRSYIGQHWCKKYLKSINIILNVTSGVVAKEKDFFERAYGKNVEEFKSILAMPDDFIRFRDFFDQNGLSKKWVDEYSKLSLEHKSELINLLSDVKTEINVSNTIHNQKLDYILSFYSIRKSLVEKNPLYYKRTYNL